MVSHADAITPHREIEMYILFLINLIGFTSAGIVGTLWGMYESIANLTNVTNIHVPEDANLNISQLTIKYGYNLHQHSVITQDGYIINLHRICSDNVSKNAPVVFLMHGIWESSDSWVIQGSEKALAYVLADQGFDVWMGNARGNKHALNHTILNPKEPKFWEFTWEEIGLYDLPAMIDYALEVSGRENLYYIGHSQGTTSCYVLLSTMTEYNEKIKMMFSLAPEAWMEHVKSPLVRMLTPALETLGHWFQGINTFTPSTELFNTISAFICTVIPVGCDNILYAITGTDSKINETILPVILGHMPTGASTLQFLHYGQLVLSKRFCRYDYGESKNIEKYGSSSPSDYDLSKITSPMVIYYSGNDWLSDPKDVEKLKHHLSNVYGYYYLGDFSHMDYTYADEAVNAIYKKIIAQIRKYENSEVSSVLR